MRQLLRHGLIALLLTGVVGCGFHLRGNVELPQGLQTLALDGTASEVLMSQLRRSLYNNGAVLVPRSEAPVVLQLGRDQFERRVITLSTSGKAREYALTLRVGFTLQDTEGKALIAQQVIELERDYRFDETNVLGSGGEEAQLKREMLRDAASRILQRLQAQAVEAGL